MYKYFKDCSPLTKLNTKEVVNLIETRYIKALEAKYVHNFTYLPVLEFLLKKEKVKLFKRVKSSTTNACLKRERQNACRGYRIR